MAKAEGGKHMSIEAMKQALEALESAVDQLAKPYSTQAQYAITSLRQAIAEAEKQEPVAMQMDVIVVNLVREGINKHRARELAEHFIKHTHPQPKREWVGPSPVEHWCTYCQGHNSHNCQFNTNFPRIQTYVTNTTNPPKREWVGLTPADFDKLEQLFGNKVSNDFVFADIVCVISAKLKEKNT
jgi:hypothetical protein